MAAVMPANILEENTELFDLFGEEGFCTICQTTLAEGERVRGINKCQHLYHAECLEPWLRNHSTCPVCRVDVFPLDEYEIAYNNTMTNLWTIIQAQIMRIQSEYHRRLLSWVVYDGIIHHLPNATAFNQQIATLQNYLIDNRVIVNDIEIYELNIVRNRTQFNRELRAITDGISRLDGIETVRQIRVHRDVQQIRNLVETFATTREDFRRIWS
jgi:hypothetical protein